MITGPVPVSPHDAPKPRRSHQSARALIEFRSSWPAERRIGTPNTRRLLCQLSYTGQGFVSLTGDQICHSRATSDHPGWDGV